MCQKKRKLLISLACLATRRSIAQFGLILDEVFQVLITFFNAGLRLVSGVVITALARQVVDVTGGNLDNAQLGHLGHFVIYGDDITKCLKLLSDGLNALTFSGVGFNSSFSCHVFIISLLGFL